MPYIASERRRADLQANPFEAQDVGELNFAITSVVLNFLPKEPHYEDYNSILGVLESVKQEFYRRAVAPYEDTKIDQNGDVGFGDL